jgi:hypothetical protein
MTGKILEVMRQETGAIAVVIELLSGEFEVGMKLRIKSSHWRIVSFVFIPAKSYATGLRAIVLRPDGPVNGLEPGDILVSE